MVMVVASSLLVSSASTAEEGSAKTDPSANMVTLKVTPLDFTNPNAGIAARVCIHGTDTCMTNVKGKPALIKLPAGKDVALRVIAEGYVTANWYLTPTKAAEDVIFATPLIPTSMQMLLGGMFGFEVTPTKGHIFFGTATLSKQKMVSGVTVKINPAKAERTIYNGRKGPDSALTKTGNGTGGFFNVEPGSYEITGTHPRRTCTSMAGQRMGTTNEAVKVDVIGGEATYMVLVCEQARKDEHVH